MVMPDDSGTTRFSPLRNQNDACAGVKKPSPMHDNRANRVDIVSFLPEKRVV